MLPFSKRTVLMEKYREWIETKSAKLGTQLPYCPEGFLVFLNEIGLIDEGRATSFVLFGNADIVTFNFKEEKEEAESK